MRVRVGTAQTTTGQISLNCGELVRLSQELVDWAQVVGADDPDAPLFPGKFKCGHTHGTRNEGTRAARTPNWAEPIEPNLFYKNVLKPALRAAGLPVSTPATRGTPPDRGVRLHDLRHTFATMALDDGHDYREVSEWLGHADYATTLRVYAHWIPDTRENNIERPARPGRRQLGEQRRASATYGWIACVDADGQGQAAAAGLGSEGLATVRPPGACPRVLPLARTDGDRGSRASTAALRRR